MPGSMPVALVTGARTGIGRFLAEHLIAAGYQVVGCSREAADFGTDKYIHARTDVSDETQVVALLRTVRKSHGRLDVVLNCAAAASMNHTLLTPASTVERLMNTNVLGVFLVSREAAKLMRTRRFGRIVNFSSVAAPLRLEGQAVYAASKSAVVMLSQVMAREFADFGITVNVVGPAPTSTDMIRGVPKRKIESLISSMPIKRMGTFEDVANVVDFFLRAESAAITGQVIYLGGVTG